MTYRRQLVLLGLLLGAGFGLWNLMASARHPLAEDTPTALLLFYGPMFAAWGAAAFAASRRTGRVRDGIGAGATVAFVTFVVFDLAVMLRVNWFLDSLRGRPDWQNLMTGFEASRFESLRAYVNFRYLTGAPFKILVASVMGAVIGAGAGFLGSVSRRPGRHKYSAAV
jgi:hypothetical protein